MRVDDGALEGRIRGNQVSTEDHIALDTVDIVIAPGLTPGRRRYRYQRA